MLNAIYRVKGECELAESEAFRIAYVTWFDQSNQLDYTNHTSSDRVRGKTWDNFADCVDGEIHFSDGRKSCCFKSIFVFI